MDSSTRVAATDNLLYIGAFMGAHRHFPQIRSKQWVLLGFYIPWEPWN